MSNRNDSTMKNDASMIAWPTPIAAKKNNEQPANKQQNFVTFPFIFNVSPIFLTCESIEMVAAIDKDENIMKATRPSTMPNGTINTAKNGKYLYTMPSGCGSYIADI